MKNGVPPFTSREQSDFKERTLFTCNAVFMGSNATGNGEELR